jgi:autotransporter-associated beta strand protein
MPSAVGASGPIVLNDDIISGGITVGNDFATYGGNGVTALTVFQTAQDTVTTWVATDNVKLTLNANPAVAAQINGNRTINSLTIVAQNTAQTLDLRTFNLIVDTGGISQSGGQTLNISNTGGSATTGTITAGVDPVSNKSELFALAANTINFNNPIVNFDASHPTTLTIGGGGTVRLANTSNAFTGGINLSSSTLLAQATANTGSVLGPAATPNAINFTGSGTLNLRDQGSASNQTFAYNNPVNVFSNSTISVDRGAGSNTGNTFQLGALVLDTGRTLTVTGANTYRLAFTNTTLNGDATLNTASADVTLGALNDLGTARTFTKTGPNTLTLGTATSTWTGTAAVNGGILSLTNATALGSAAPRVVVNNGGTLNIGVNNQNLSNVTFNGGAALRISGTMDSSAPGTIPTTPVTILELNNAAIGANYDNVPLNPTGAIVRQVLGAAVTYASDLALPGHVAFDIPSQATTFTGNITGTNGSILKAGTNVLNLAPATGTNTYGGGTFVEAGTLNANTTGSLGTGPVIVINGILGYNAPNPAGGGVITANGASLQQFVGQINLGFVNSFGSDRFDIAAGNVIAGDTTRFAMLSRYGNATTPANINLAPGAIVAHNVPNGGTISDLGTATDLFYGLGLSTAATNITVGANTPWMGLSTDRGGRTFATGDILVDDGSNGGTQTPTFTSLIIQGINGQTFTLGNGSTATPPPTANVTIRKSNPGNSTIDVHLVGRVAMNASSTNFDGVNKFVGDYGSFVMLNAFNTLGGGGGTQPVPLEMLAGSVVDIGGGATPAPGALNGNITMRAGSAFRVDDASQFRGTGQIFGKPGSIFMLRGNADILMNGGSPLIISPQVTGNGVADSEGTLPGLTNAQGAIFRLEIDNINQLDAGTSDQGIFSVTGGNRIEGALTINSDSSLGYLNGGMTIYDNNSRTYTGSALNIGSGGAFFSANGSASGTFTLTIATATPINVSAGAALTIGSPKIDFFDKNGHVQIDGPFQGNPLASITKITSGDLVLNNASTGIAGNLVTGDIVGNGGGNLKFGNNNTTLSSRLLAGTVANNILVNDLVKSDINIDGTPFTTTTRGTVLQKFTISGNTNTDGRKLFVSRRAGSVVAGIDLANIVLNGGSVLTVDEDNTDVRVNLTLAGDGTIAQAINPTGGLITDSFDLINVSSDTTGTRRMLTQGRLTDISTGANTSTMTLLSTVFGNLSADMTINQVRGRLSFDAASQILAPTGTQTGAIINSLGADGNGPASEGYIEVHAGQSGTGALASGTVNLGSGTALQIFVDESGGDQIVNNPNLTVNIIPNSSGTIGSNRNVASAISGRALLNSVNVGANSTLFMNSANNAETAIGTVNMAGDGTIVNVASDSKIFVGNVAAGANKLTFDGTRHTQVTGNVTAGQLASNGFVDFNPGAANTSTVSAGSVSVRGAITASSGITNFGTATITGTPAATVAGLSEGVLPGDFNTSDSNPGSFVRLGPLQAKVRVTNSDPGMIQGWASHTTYVYTGQILIPNSNGDGTGTIAIGDGFDDSVQVKIDGNEVLSDTIWNATDSSGALTFSEGWHEVEFRFGQGVGGVGAVSAAGWNSLLAFGLQIGTTGPFDNKSDGTTPGTVNAATQSRYVFPVDNGSMNLFRVQLPASGDVNVGAGAELRAGGLSGIVNANLNGATGSTAMLTLVDTGGPVSSTITNVVVNGDAAISHGSSSSIAAENLNVAFGANLTLSGGGTLTVSTGHSLGDGSNINVNGSKLVINSTAGPGQGGITVNTDGRLGGIGNIIGTVTLNSGGHVAPGNSVGTISVGGLTLNSGALLDVEGDGTGFDRINVTIDNAFSIAGPTTISLTDLGGVTAGDYVLIDYGGAFTGNFSDLSLASTSLGSFTASLVDDTADTSIKLHVALGGNPQWNVDADGSWSLAANWQPQVVPDGAATGASFLGKITAPRTVTLDGSRTVGSLNFDNANKYTIAAGTGGTLNIGDATTAGSVTVGANSHEISAAVAINGNTNVTVGAGGGLTLSGGLSIAAGKTATKGGDGSLTISGAQNHAAGATLRVTRGTVNLNSNAGVAGSAADSHLALNVAGNVDNAGGKVVLGTNQDLNELSVAYTDGGTQTLDLASPGGAGQFHSVTVYAASLAAAKTALYNAIANANAAGAVDPLDGITDSGLHANSKIGLAQQGSSIFIRPTRVGDLNLDGNVSISDFIDLASNFGSVGTATWQEGDLNYDHNVSISDFIDLASNFGSSYAGSAGAVSAADVQTLANFASSIGVDPGVIGSAVPEPGTLSLLAVGAMGLMSRRRRKA